MLTTVKLYNEIALDGHVNTAEVLRKSSQYLQECINEIRFISHQLSAPTLGNISLYDSLDGLTKSITSTGKVQVTLKTGDKEGFNLREDFHLAVYRIVQEQLNNILKYADASAAVITIQNAGDLLRVSVQDNGRGFDPKAKSKGIGLINMKARAESFGGTLQIQSALGQGCRLTATFPLVQPARDQAC
jgi:signal transduction histidine kinase